MGDLKTFFDKAVYPNTTDLGGDLAESRGSDPNASGDAGEGALQDFWDPGQAQPNNRPIVDGATSTEESQNSVSGLPALPNRFQPSDTNIEDVPDLTRRSPGTIDKK